MTSGGSSRFNSRKLVINHHPPNNSSSASTASTGAHLRQPQVGLRGQSQGHRDRYNLIDFGQRKLTFVFLKKVPNQTAVAIVQHKKFKFMEIFKCYLDELKINIFQNINLKQ